jgi:hypothetical protein
MIEFQNSIEDLRPQKSPEKSLYWDLSDQFKHILHFNMLQK